jgi:hypothetical protein
LKRWRTGSASRFLISGGSRSCTFTAYRYIISLILTSTRLQDYRVQEYRLSSPPSSECNVIRQNLSEDSQDIPCAPLTRRGSWVISVYLWSRVIQFWYLEPTANDSGMLREQRCNTSLIS